MSFEIIVLEPARDFLENLQVKLRAKAFRTIELLREFGPFLTQPHTKSVKGYEGLHELRVKYASDICRIFYFHFRSSTFVLTSGYVKKERKLSKTEIERAVSLMKRFREERNG